MKIVLSYIKLNTISLLVMLALIKRFIKMNLCCFYISLEIQCENIFKNIHFNAKSKCACLTCAVLRGGSLFHFLNEEIEHLCLYKFLHKPSCALGFYCFTEICSLELALLVFAFPHNVLREVTDSLDKERQESFWHHPVQLLKTWSDDKWYKYMDNYYLIWIN